MAEEASRNASIAVGSSEMKWDESQTPVILFEFSSRCF